METNEKKVIDLIKKVGGQVFINPHPLLDFEKLVKNSLGPNTYRGFHRIQKEKPGSKGIFENLLLSKSAYIVDKLLIARTEKEIDLLETEISSLLKKELKKNIINKQLDSFNKVRKPLDIFIEHLVAMHSGFSDQRSIITKHLFLPLDSQMFKSEFVFSVEELKKIKIKRSFTYKDIKEEAHYYEIQNFLREKAVKIGIENRIFFDLIWNDRYKSNGTNLFATNPK